MKTASWDIASLEVNKQQEAQILQRMKKELLFLRQYAAELRLRSTLYQTQDTPLQAEDELVDYLHYTRSVLDLRTTSHEQQDPVLAAMELHHQTHTRRQERDQRAYRLLQAILQLPKQEKALLLDLYVRNLDRRLVQQHQGDIVESTLYRRLQRAMLHVFALLYHTDTL